MLISVLIILLSYLSSSNCELNTTTSNLTTADLLDTYEKYLNTSLELEVQDLRLTETWSQEIQVQVVNITSVYRIQMASHRDHSFKRISNKKWRECLDIFQDDIFKLDTYYSDNERKCLKAANSADVEKKAALHQIDREIRKWRKSYKFLKKLCHSNNLIKEAEESCLVQYMQTDNFNQVIERLLVFKLQSMSDLHDTITIAKINLEECSRRNLARYLVKIRNMRNVLNKCYR